MKKIKLIEVIADSSLSGAPKHVLTLISKIDKSRFSITLICPEGWLVEQIKNQEAKIKNIPLANFFDFRSILKLRKIIKQENPNIIHLHGIRAGWLGVLAARESKQKIIYTEHLYTKDYHLQSRFKEWIQLQGLSYILKNVRIIITSSKAVKSFLINKFKIRNKKIKVVYNGLEDLSRGAKRREILGSFSRRIGYIGSLNYQKGVDILLEAFAQVKKELSDCHLEIIGDGPSREDLEQKAKKISSNIHFVGAKNDIWHYLANWQILVIPSRSESFGQTAVEAAIMSKPVVVAKVGGLPEVVVDKKTGILVKPNDPNSLARAIIYLLKNPEVGKELGERGKLRYEELFIAKKMIDKIEKIYEKI